MIKKFHELLKREGFFGLIGSIIFRSIANLFAVPIVIFILLISPFIRIRFIALFSVRIGHYALNTELLLCAMKDNLWNEKNRKKVNFFFTCPFQPISNTQLHRMWKRTITILPAPYLWQRVDELLKLICRSGYKNDPFKKKFESTTGGSDGSCYIHKIEKPHISFTWSETQRAKEILAKWGLPKDAKFICLICRDSNYLKTHAPQYDWSYHDYRDVEVNSYKDVAKFLAEKGYYVFRMGKYVESKFDVNDPRVIDYANSPLRSDFMDIYLSAQCYFMISSSCGLDAVAHIFRRPILVTNIPLFDVRSYYFWKLFIFKKIIDLKTNKLISATKILQVLPNSLDRRLINEVLRENNWGVIDNTPGEIVKATEEMLNILSDASHETKEDIFLQEKFWTRYPIELTNNMSSYRDMKFRVSKDFLTKCESDLFN